MAQSASGVSTCPSPVVLEDAYLLQGHVAGNLKDDNGHEEQLVAQVDGVEVHVDVLGEPSRQGAGDVHAIELEDE